MGSVNMWQDEHKIITKMGSYHHTRVHSTNSDTNHSYAEKKIKWKQNSHTV